MKIANDLTDRELLELAAKAAGYNIVDKSHPISVYIYSDGCKGGVFWNPLKDDGDAFRLAVKCRMNVNIYYNDTRVTADDVFLCEMHEVDLCAATRRAIVRVAAEIARSKV